MKHEKRRSLLDGNCSTEALFFAIIYEVNEYKEV